MILFSFLKIKSIRKKNVKKREKEKGRKIFNPLYNKYQYIKIAWQKKRAYILEIL